MAGLINLRDGRSWIAALALASLAVTMAYGLGDSQWSFASRCDNRDTATFYYAAKAALIGMDPYNGAALKQNLGFAWWVYPPSGLPFFFPLAALPVTQAIIAFNIVKAIALAGLVGLWCCVLPSLRRDAVFWLFAVAGLNTTLQQDWCSGNIATFESVAVWGALLLAWRGRYRSAVGLILLISLIKPLWLILLLLPVAAAPRVVQARRATIVGIVIGATLLLAWPVLYYASVQGWLYNAITTLPMRYNMFELVKDLRVGLGGALAIPPWQRPEFALYLLWVALVGVLLWRQWRAAYAAPSLLPALLLILAIPAANPANLSYSWLIVVPIVYLALLKAPPLLRIVMAVLAFLPGPLVELVLPYRDIGMIALLAVMVAFVVLALQRPQPNIRADHDQVAP